MNKNRKVSILRYWTTRYLLTLLIGLLIIAALSLFWIRQTTVDHRLNVTQLVAQEMADRVATEGAESGTLPREEVPDFFQERQSVLNIETNPLIYIVDNNGESITSNAIRGFEPELAFPASVLEKQDSIQRLNIDMVGSAYLVKAPIIQDGINIGWVVIIQPVNEVAQLNQEYGLVAIMVVALALLGWLTIYILSRRLSFPVKRVSGAAKLVKEQNYNFTLPENIREKEIHELVDSFKEMSARLQRLEKLRTELLAGVTHELKTPVTSISGLLQAVKDDVVTDEEAAEFIDISLKETERMKTMVVDLLAFNTFSANGVNVVMEKREMGGLLQEVVHQWGITNKESRTTLQLDVPDEEIYVQIDSARLQQIMINLLNNAQQSFGPEAEGTIHVNVKQENGQAYVEVTDSGKGIEEKEKEYIFERFFRGENKKYETHGLGLGLAFSLMIAQSLHGDLTLKNSNPGETTFVLRFPAE